MRGPWAVARGRSCSPAPTAVRRRAASIACRGSTSCARVLSRDGRDLARRRCDAAVAASCSRSPTTRSSRTSAAGEPFASTAFIQERLDAFMARVGRRELPRASPRRGRRGRRSPSASSRCPAPAPRGSVRVYGRRARRGGAARGDAPTTACPSSTAGPRRATAAPQFVATLARSRVGADGRARSRVELWRARRRRRRGAAVEHGDAVPGRRSG